MARVTRTEAYSKLDSYQAQWDAKRYLKQYYSIVVVPDETNEVLKFLVEQMAKRGSKGLKGLDFGCGPTIWGMLPLAPYISEIDIADYMPDNLAEIASWLQGDSDAHDWSLHTAHVLKLENHPMASKDAVLERENLLRRKVRHLVECDIRRELPNALAHREYDLVVSLYCLECIANSFQDWQQFLSRLTNTVGPKGTFIAAAILNADTYSVGDLTFEMTRISEGELRTELKNCGFSDSSIELRSMTVEAWKHEGFDQIALVAASRT